jgi:hypothetical protein
MSDRRARGLVAVRVGAGQVTAATVADVELDVRASATAVRARSRARTRTRAVGASGDVERRSWRRNLPSRLEPGRVARDVAVRRRVAARLADPGEG